jgi:GDP-mannose 6-dehydrogenase
MVSSIEEVLDHASTIVIGNSATEFRDVPRRLREGQSILDLVRVTDSRSVDGVYEGICW